MLLMTRSARSSSELLDSSNKSTLRLVSNIKPDNYAKTRCRAKGWRNKCRRLSSSSLHMFTAVVSAADVASLRLASNNSARDRTLNRLLNATNKNKQNRESDGNLQSKQKLLTNQESQPSNPKQWLSQFLVANIIVNFIFVTQHSSTYNFLAKQPICLVETACLDDQFIYLPISPVCVRVSD